MIHYPHQDAIGGNDALALRDNVCAALTAEFTNLRRFFRGAVCNPNRSEGGFSFSEYVFGGEVVEIGIQSYRKFWISRLLMNVLFGKDLDVFADGIEVISRTKKRVVVHICSQSRMAEIFTLAGWCAVEHDGDVGVRTCGG